MATGRSSVLFHCALQRMLVTAGGLHHHGDLGLGHLVGEDAADPDAMLVHMQHDAGGVLARLVEEALQHVDDEFHRRVVVVDRKSTRLNSSHVKTSYAAFCLK